MEQFRYFDYQHAIPESVPQIVVNPVTKDTPPETPDQYWGIATVDATKHQQAYWDALTDEGVSVWSGDQPYFPSMPDDRPTLGAVTAADMSKGLMMTGHDTTSLGVYFAHDLSAGTAASPLSRSRLYPSSQMTHGMIDNHHQRDGHQCLWARCSLWCSTLEQLTIHIRDEHVGSGKPAYFCQWAGCPRSRKPFTKRHKMHNHMRTHTGERPFECTVKGCNKKFSRPDSLSTHIKTHSNIRPYNCSVPGCGKAYFHSRSLRKHMRSHEEDQSAAKNNANAPRTSSGAATSTTINTGAHSLLPSNVISSRYSHHYAPYRLSSSRIKRNNINNPVSSSSSSAGTPACHPFPATTSSTLTMQNEGFFPVIDPSTTSSTSWPYNNFGFN